MIRFQTDKFFVTWPQCDATKSDILAIIRSFVHTRSRHVVNFIVAEEKHQDGNPHVHAYFSIDKKLTNEFDSRALDINGHHPCIEAAKSEKHSVAYVAKDGDYITDIPEHIVKRYIKESEESKARKSQGKKMPDSDYLRIMSGELDLKEMLKIYPREIRNLKKWKESLREYKLLYRDEVQHLPKGDLRDRFWWIVGAPGVGKSEWVNENYPNIWEKPNNPWWNGYLENDCPKEVLFSDVDATWSGQIWLFKVWFDRWKFQGRITANDPVYIRFERGFVTSNYTIREWVSLCGIENEKLCEALERRFRTVRIGDLPSSTKKSEEMEVEVEKNYMISEDSMNMFIESLKD